MAAYRFFDNANVDWQAILEPHRQQTEQSGGPKESLRWIEGYERLAELAPRLSATRLVYVADREADMAPLMVRAQQLDCPVDWLVRAAHNRCLPNSDKLWPHSTQGAVLGDIEFALAARPGSKARPLHYIAGRERRTGNDCITRQRTNAPHTPRTLGPPLRRLADLPGPPFAPPTGEPSSVRFQAALRDHGKSGRVSMAPITG